MGISTTIESTPFIGIIIPFRNEAQGLPAFLHTLIKTLDTVGESYEIICVDDGSEDAGWEILQGAARTDKRVKGIQLNRHFGKESAIRAGLRAVSAHAAIIMDADLQHPPELIPEMIQAWGIKNVLVVEAVKKTSSRKNIFARLSLWVYGIILKKTANIEFHNRTDFMLIDRKIIDRINHLPERITFFRGIVEWFGYASYKIEFEVQKRSTGKPSWSRLNSVNLAIDGITVFTSAPLRLVTACGIIFSVLALMLVGHTLYLKLSGRALEGFTTVIICILVVGSVLTMGLGIIGEYIARIYEEVKQRPVYIVKQTANLEAENQAVSDLLQ